MYPLVIDDFYVYPLCFCLSPQQSSGSSLSVCVCVHGPAQPPHCMPDNPGFASPTFPRSRKHIPCNNRCLPPSSPPHLQPNAALSPMAATAINSVPLRFLLSAWSLRLKSSAATGVLYSQEEGEGEGEGSPV